MNEILFVVVIFGLITTIVGYLYCFEHKTKFDGFFAYFSPILQFVIMAITFVVAIFSASGSDVLGFSKKERQEIRKLKGKVLDGVVTKKEKDEYLSYKLNGLFGIVVCYVFIAGLVVFLLGLIVH